MTRKNYKRSKHEMDELEAAAKRPLFKKLRGELEPDRWLNSSDFPAGKNPWIDIFSDDVVETIRKTTSISGSEDSNRLQVLLAATAEQVSNEISGGTGETKSDAEILEWSKRMSKKVHSLITDLSESDAYIYSDQWKDKDGTIRVAFAESMSKSVSRTIDALEDLSKFVPKRSARNYYPFGSTKHSYFLQLMTNGVTAVFIEFRGLDHVKQGGKGSHKYGEFPDFVRAAVKPMVQAYYPDVTKRKKWSSELNRQIQTAIHMFTRNL